MAHAGDPLADVMRLDPCGAERPVPRGPESRCVRWCRAVVTKTTVKHVKACRQPEASRVDWVVDRTIGGWLAGWMDGYARGSRTSLVNEARVGQAGKRKVARGVSMEANGRNHDKKPYHLPFMSVSR